MACLTDSCDRQIYIFRLRAGRQDEENALRLKTYFPSRFNVIWVVQISRKKYSAFRTPQIIGILCPSRPSRGAFAIVTNVERDAVDADAPLTNGA
jgi:hypothetical protein